MGSIKVIIKAPNQKLVDQTVTCDIDWTVSALKAHISSVYPTKPRIEDQRLIYSGHLLNNQQTLREILQPIDSIEDNHTFTIHLVCAQSPNETNSSTKTNHNSSIANNSNTMDANNSDQNNSNNSQTNSNNLNNAFNGQFSPNMLTNANAMIPPDQLWQQMSYVQQAYAQYMAQYMAQNPYINQSFYNNNMLQNNIPPMTPPMAAPQAAPEVVANGALAPPQAPQVQRMNAGPGGQAVIDDDDEGRNRDWLDCFYWMSRAVVLFSIIYFYSSFTRFLLVIFLSVLLYLYQTNWFNRNRNNNRQQPNVANNNNNNNVNNNNNNNNNNINNNNNNNEEQLPNEEVVADDTEVLDRQRQQLTNNSIINDERVTEERFSGLRFVWVVVSSLFTSLIPDNPAANLN
ncbi:homocysteine-responsive endoplasmic reticulum-resident ubiquitin-like domain member 2 protein [Oppia nitens]|uniref:homocysteine-responsive endoplasmic reticulum-resident ubiquitin-like domain member 2 protein n=1 Tax=Oppia nitens TaxID=1686743 RepID=UPI0023DCC6FF|nr:homocysteine-responsive endoplasmic reticulum-resident ubiquitin-like domain member 2 protein [Oppia nitens]